MCRVNLHTRATETTITTRSNVHNKLSIQPSYHTNFAKHCRDYLSHCFMCASLHITNHIFTSYHLEIRHQRPHTMNLMDITNRDHAQPHRRETEKSPCMVIIDNTDQNKFQPSIRAPQHHHTLRI